MTTPEIFYLISGICFGASLGTFITSMAAMRVMERILEKLRKTGL